MQCPSLDDLSPDHLAECDRCRRLLALHEKQRAKLREAEAGLAIPEGFQQRLKLRLDRVQEGSEAGHMRSSGTAGRFFRGLGLAACLALALLPWMQQGRDPGRRLMGELAQHHGQCWSHSSDNSARVSQVARWVAAHPAAEVPSPLVASAGFTEKERRICPFADLGHGPHLLLHDRQGRPASLFVMPLAEVHNQAGLSAKPVAYRVGDEVVALWHGPNWAFGMVAQGTPAEILQWIQPAIGSDRPWRILAAK